MEPRSSEHPSDHRDDVHADLAEVARRFRLAWTAPDDPQTDNAELFPQRLAKASAEALGVDGAGLSVYDSQFRVPLGASSDAASLAERLQFTQGEGPCLSAIRRQGSVVADPETLDATWPAFAAELRRVTPFRAVISLPIKTLDFAGALDLYLSDPTQLRRVSVADAVTVGREIGSALDIIEAMDPSAEADRCGQQPPAWLLSPSARSRTLVWVAAGTLMARLHLDAIDAVALLRSYSYGNGSLIDDVARRIVDGDLDTDALGL